MNRLSLLWVAVFATTSLLAQKTINDPNAETRNVSGFHAIRISNSFDVYISQGNQEAVAVSASKPEYREKIETKVENGVLIIRFDNEKKFWKGWNGDKVKLKAYISVKNLDRLSVSGACNIFIDEAIKAEELTISLSGASDLKGKVDVNKLVLDISGASDMKMAGVANSVNIDASGASDFEAFDLTTDYCDAHATGASSISITVKKELSAKASGASDVKFKGSGMIKDIRTSGASSVSRKG